MTDIADKMLECARAPGQASIGTITEVKVWLEQFNQMLNVYRSVHGEPLGGSVEMKIKDLVWYENRAK